MPGTIDFRLKPKPTMTCDACRRQVERTRQSMWHGDHRICLECFHEWYDGHVGVDCTDPISIGNYVRKQHGLEPL